ncbi:hypothetical protein BD413DRAFT_202472 [Trametes elegans]|nr:hypothetical protein BD413DRAFT_202472 [Trametes elegans]
MSSLGSTFGAFFLGTSFGSILYGVTLQQAFRYFRRFKNDPPAIRHLVATALVLDTFHTACCIHASYYHLVTNYFNPVSLRSAVWSLKLIAFLSGIAAILAQLFYARRVYIFGQELRYKVLVAISAVLMLSEFVFTIVATAEVYSKPIWTDFQRLSWLVSTVSGLALTCDMILTGTLISILVQSRTGFKSTDSLIDVLVLYAVTTGLLSLIVMVFIFVFGLVLPGNLIYIAIGILGTKLYVGSVLAALNSRLSLAGRFGRGLSEIDVPVSDLDGGSYGKDACLSFVRPSARTPFDSDSSRAARTSMQSRVDSFYRDSLRTSFAPRHPPPMLVRVPERHGSMPAMVKEGDLTESVHSSPVHPISV